MGVVFAEKHFDKKYHLTGPKALDYGRVAKIIGDAIGEPVTYYKLTEEQMLKGICESGASEYGPRCHTRARAFCR